MSTASAALPNAATDSEPGLSQARIFSFFWPLALSWIFMAADAVVCAAAIARRSAPETNLAATQVMMGIAFWVESPIIDLLSTSTTLALSRGNYLRLRRFVLMLMFWVTFAHAVMTMTPLYGFVTDTLLRAAKPVADAARPALFIMLPWSAAIGWRRFLQGILIRNGLTRLVGLGTGVRVTALALTALLLFKFTDLPGATLAGIALIASVVAESAFIHIVSRPTVREQFGPEVEALEVAAGAPPLTLRRLCGFHFPLSLSTMVMLCQIPLVVAALDRLSSPILALAAWQVGASSVWILRSFCFALPEAVIALFRGDAMARPLRRFCITVGFVGSGIVFALALTGLDRLYFARVLGTTEPVVKLAHIVFLFGGALPFLTAWQAYLRGMLTAHHFTVSRLTAVIVSTAVIVAALTLGVLMKGEGVVVGSIAVILATVVELIVLVTAWRHGRAGAMA